jgi:branched-chain amino acid transport system substrate-binding protein
MKKEKNGLTRRIFLKSTGAIVGGMALGVPTLLRAQPKDIKVGLLAPLTGVSSAWGPRTYNGCLLSAQLINDAGGIKSMGGAKIKVVVADTETKPEIAGIQTEKLIGDKDILIVTGSNQSSATMVATQVAERHQICFITGTDGTPEITQRGFQFTYRTTPTMVDYARDLIYFARDMGKQTGKAVKKVAILCENSIFGTAAGDNASKFSKEVGFDIVDYSKYDPATTRDFTGYISKYKSAGVDFLACHNRPQDGILITRTMKELDFNPLGYGGMLGAHSVSDFPEALGKDSDFTLTTSNFVEEANIPGLKELSAKYREVYKTPPDTNFLAGFSVIPLLRAALEANPTYDRVKIKETIDKTELKTGEYNNMQINGVKWDPNHDNTLAQAFVLQYEGGVMHPVSPAAYASRKPVWPRPTWNQIKKM